MKKLSLTFVVLSSIFLLSSCIYESEVPVDQAGLVPEAKLLYKWEEEKSKDVYTVKRLDDLHYEINMYSQSSKAETKFSAHSTIIDGVCFLNIRNVDKEHPSNKYSIVKLEWLDENSFKIYPLTENIREQFNNSTELKAFIRSNMKDPYFYEEAAIFKKKNHK